METRERNVKPSLWTAFEELPLKECVFYLNSVDKLNDISPVDMYNSAVKDGESIKKGIFHNHYRLPIGEVWKMSNV